MMDDLMHSKLRFRPTMRVGEFTGEKEDIQ